jgi:hypothetical protein
MVVDSEAVRKATKEFDARLSAFVSQLSDLHNGAFDDSTSKTRDNCQSVIYLRVVALLEQFIPPRLPSHIYFHRLIQSGEELLAAREYDLACNECFNRFLRTPESKRGLIPDNESARLECIALDFRANAGIIMCQFFMAVEHDSEVRKSSTADEVLCQLDALRELVEVGFQP